MKIQNIQRLFGLVLNMILSVYMLLILIVMPFYNQEGFSHIGTDKSTFLRACNRNTAKILVPVLLLYLVFTLIREIQKKSLSQTVQGIRLSVTEYFMLAYAGCVLLSYAFSDYRDVVWRGQEGWYMGTTTQLAMVAIFFLIGRTWKRQDWLFFTILPTSAVVFALGFINRFGIYPIDMKVDNVMFISTIGNINWYCGYMMSVFFSGFALLWQSERWKWWQNILLGAYVVVGYASLVTQGSSSGIITLLAMFLVTFCFSVSNEKRMCMFWTQTVIFFTVCLLIRLLRLRGWATITYIEASTEWLTNSTLPIVMTIVSVSILLWLVCLELRKRYPESVFRAIAVAVCASVLVLFVAYVIVLVINTVTDGKITDMTGMPQNDLLTFSPKWGSNRGATWTAGVLCFLEQDLWHKLFGAGPDGMASFLYAGGSEKLLSLVKETFGSSRLTNAHNEWLTILVNLGVLGFVSYVGMMVSAIWRFLRQRNNSPIVTACGFCLLAYTVNNMFSFQQAMNVSTIFILLGIGENYLRQSREKKSA
ncbi:MAG: O-antigen ligase family protein [Acetatifactor sp.]|nr:O-antigen ligase family protein [Acetatifactor sp.]